MVLNVTHFLSFFFNPIPLCGVKSCAWSLSAHLHIINMQIYFSMEHKFLLSIIRPKSGLKLTQPNMVVSWEQHMNKLDFGRKRPIVWCHQTSKYTQCVLLWVIFISICHQFENYLLLITMNPNCRPNLHGVLLTQICRLLWSCANVTCSVVTCELWTVPIIPQYSQVDVLRLVLSDSALRYRHTHTCSAIPACLSLALYSFITET